MSTQKNSTLRRERCGGEVKRSAASEYLGTTNPPRVETWGMALAGCTKMKSMWTKP